VIDAQASQRPSEPRTKWPTRGGRPPSSSSTGASAKVWCIIPSGHRKFTDASSIDSTISPPSPVRSRRNRAASTPCTTASAATLSGRNVRTNWGESLPPCPATIDDIAWMMGS
jgi:hypothetical protein